MLNQVTQLIAERGWFDISRPFDKTVHLTHGAAQTLLLSRGGRAECFVKFSNCSSLRQEAERCASASRRFPGMAPVFIGHDRVGSLEVLVTQAVAFRAMHADLMRSHRYMGVLQERLEEYFRHMRMGARVPTQIPSWVSEYRAYFARSPWQRAADEALKDMLEVLNSGPCMDQHGDFVVNNLGLGRQGRLAVFDWEDFGAVDSPGLDLFTLEASVHEASAGGSLGRRQRIARGHRLDVARLCDAMGLPVEVYDRLRLSYAFVFRFLKRNYGPEVRARVDRLLHRLSATDPAVAVA